MGEVALVRARNGTAKSCSTMKESCADEVHQTLLALLPSPSSDNGSASISSSRDERTIGVMMPNLRCRRLGPHTPWQATNAYAGGGRDRRSMGGAAGQRVAPGHQGRGTSAPYTTPSCGIGITGVGSHVQEKGKLAERGPPPPCGWCSAGMADVLTTVRQSLASRGPIVQAARGTCP